MNWKKKSLFESKYEYLPLPLPFSESCSEYSNVHQAPVRGDVLTATSLSVYTEMFQNNHVVEICPKKENKFLVGVFFGTGIACIHSAHFHPPLVCGVVTIFFILVLFLSRLQCCGDTTHWGCLTQCLAQSRRLVNMCSIKHIKRNTSRLELLVLYPINFGMLIRHFYFRLSQGIFKISSSIHWLFSSMLFSLICLCLFNSFHSWFLVSYCHGW